MRQNYIDNLRSSLILLLFPYHTFMIYNGWGENFYIRGPQLQGPTIFNICVWPWFMSTLFVLAGISTFFELQKKSMREYVKERILKLFVPLISGILLLIPLQTYLADVFHNQYDKGYLYHYIVFFTKETDLTGYSGGFTTGQLWFVLYLLIISLLALPIIALVNRIKINKSGYTMSLAFIILIGIIPYVMRPIASIGGKSLFEYLSYFLIGYFVLSSNAVIDKITKQSSLLLIASLLMMIINIWIWNTKLIPINGILFSVIQSIYGWFSMLSLIGIYKNNFDGKVFPPLSGTSDFYKLSNTGNILIRFIFYLRTNLHKLGISHYFSDASFAIYLFHQSFIVLFAFIIFKLTSNVIIQIPFIIISSFVATLLFYEIVRRIGILSKIFGLKQKRLLK